MLADELDFVVAVDPHRGAHAVGVVEVRSGVVVFESSVAADGAGDAEAFCGSPTSVRRASARSRSREQARSGLA
jgi:hypothetical protein